MASAVDPLRQFIAWHARARRAGTRDPNAMVLATATREGRPSARVVLYKGIRDGAVRFFTNYDSRKASELDRNPRAALVFYWPEIYRQVRISGRVHRASAAESDEYWSTRPRASQIGARASKQSRRLESWAALLARAKQLEAQFRGRPIPRPANWGGYHLIPDTVEFWAGGTGRLHRRVRFRKSKTRWKREELYP